MDIGASFEYLWLNETLHNSSCRFGSYTIIVFSDGDNKLSYAICFQPKMN